MNCRICNRPCTPLFQLENQPAGVQHLPETPDSKGITLNIVQCTGCGLVQLDNEPVSYWKEVIRSSRLSEKINAYAESVDSFNELEHQPNPTEYLDDLYNFSYMPITITVPNCNEMRMYDYCIDHLMYFTDETLDFALQINGFQVGMIREVLDGTTLEATVERRPFMDASDNFDWFWFYGYVHNNGVIGIYGAGHQAFSLLALGNINNTIKLVIDDNPDKQGRYTPATNIPIFGPDKLNELDAIIVMAGGYSDEIVKKLDTFKGSVAVLKGNKIEVIR